MPLLYSVVSRGTTVLARYANNCTGNFSEITEQVLAQIGIDDSKMTYSHGSYLFHYILQNRIIYLCISDDVWHVFMCTLRCYVNGSFIFLGIWALQSFFVPEWNKKEIYLHFWSTCIFCTTLCNEHGVFKNSSRINGNSLLLKFILREFFIFLIG